MQNIQKLFGMYYTPRPIAEFLARWAIRKKDDLVLEPAAGNGVFCEVAAERLHSLGTERRNIGRQIYAVEIDRDSFLLLRKNLSAKYDVPYNNTINTSFFALSPSETKLSSPFSIPYVDVVLGNPPYIEYQKFDELQNIHCDVFSHFKKSLLLADIYVYFILHSAKFIKPGGRLAFVVSDTWLSMNFGAIVKKFLSEHFKIDAIINFDQRIFNDADVRVILLLAERLSNVQPSRNEICFVQLKDVKQIEQLDENFANINPCAVNAERMIQSKLHPNESWSLYFKGSATYTRIIKHPLICHLSNIADSAIGLQTLCKDFFILDKERLNPMSLEKEFLEEIAFSPRDTPLVIKNKSEINRFVIYCDKDKNELTGTNLLRYIEKGEKTVNSLRGKRQLIIGYHNRPRIKKSNRNPWYNLKQEIQRRCRNPILLPRRIYKKYFVLNNKIRVVNNESFIGINPEQNDLIVPLLAIMNSTFGEYVCRIEAHLYGGGIFDLRPSNVTKLAVPNLAKLKSEHLEMLSKAYYSFLRAEGKDRRHLDESIREILRFDEKYWDELCRCLQRIKNVAMLLKSSFR